MPSPGTPVPPRLPIEDSYFELLADTLESLDLPARGQFLQRYLRAIAHVDLHETQSVQIWDEMLSRRRELSDLVGRPVSLKTALADVLTSSGLLRVPILIEYDELKRLGTRRRPEDVRTSASAVFRETGRPTRSLSSRRRESISSQICTLWVSCRST